MVLFTQNWQPGALLGLPASGSGVLTWGSLHCPADTGARHPAALPGRPPPPPGGQGMEVAAAHEAQAPPCCAGLQLLCWPHSPPTLLFACSASSASFVPCCHRCPLPCGHPLSSATPASPPLQCMISRCVLACFVVLAAAAPFLLYGLRTLHRALGVSGPDALPGSKCTLGSGLRPWALGGGHGGGTASHSCWRMGHPRQLQPTECSVAQQLLGRLANRMLGRWGGHFPALLGQESHACPGVALPGSVYPLLAPPHACSDFHPGGAEHVPLTVLESVNKTVFLITLGAMAGLVSIGTLRWRQGRLIQHSQCVRRAN